MMGAEFQVIVSSRVDMDIHSSKNVASHKEAAGVVENGFWCHCVSVQIMVLSLIN